MNEHQRNYALSGEDVQKVAGEKVPIYLYQDLLKFNCIHELLNRHPSKCAIILYQFADNYGHWTGLIQNSDGIEHFDSFGYAVDDEDDFIDKPKLKKYRLDTRHLSRLMSTSRVPIHYNEFVLQDDREDNPEKTCGRWVGYRIRNRKKNLYDFVNSFVKNYEEGGDNDELITTITNRYFK